MISPSDNTQDPALRAQQLLADVQDDNKKLEDLLEEISMLGKKVDAFDTDLDKVDEDLTKVTEEALVEIDASIEKMEETYKTDDL